MESASPQQPFETVGRYEIAGRIAVGGMAEILLGRLSGPSGFERVVVVKRILPHLAETESFVQMFLDEARIAANITHPNVVQVHELGKDGDDLFIIMEYLEGESVMTLLRRMLTRAQTLDGRLIAAIGAGCAAGLHAAHELNDEHGEVVNLVHRDISPQNVFLTYAGDVKVLDFGIAKAATQMTKTATGELKGKFAYMSPEQVEGRPLDRRSDIFSLGIVLYEAATGRRLFRRKTQMETLRAVSAAEVESPLLYRPELPEEIEAIILRCLKHDPAERFQTAKEVQRQLLTFFHRVDGPLPEELIAERMRGLFSDRVLEKRLMLQRLRDGSDVTHIPAGELDEEVELLPTRVRPEAIKDVAQDSLENTFVGDITPKRSLRGLVALLILIAGAAIITITRLVPGDEVRTTPLTPLERAPTADVPSRPTPPNPEVVITFTSTPPGASVRSGTELLGTTPLELSRPRADSEVTFDLELDGFQPSTLRVTPDQSVRTQTTLIPLEVEQAEEAPTKMRPRMRPRMRPVTTPVMEETVSMRFEPF